MDLCAENMLIVSTCAMLIHIYFFSSDKFGLFGTKSSHENQITKKGVRSKCQQAFLHMYVQHMLVQLFWLRKCAKPICTAKSEKYS